MGLEEVVVIGGGGHAKVVIAILHKINFCQIVGYTDLRDRGEVLGVSYLGSDDELLARYHQSKVVKAVLGIGQVSLGKARCEVFARLRSSLALCPMIISPDAVVNEGVTHGDGAVVMDGAVINSGAKIGYGAIINTNSTVEHDVELSDWVHVAPGATISGGVKVGRYSMVGAGATVIEGRTIAEGCVVGAGATVVTDLLDSGVYVGCPARRLK